MPPIPQANCLCLSAILFFFFPSHVYFCDAGFVCHHPISKHYSHPQSSTSSSSPAGIWQRTKRNTANWPFSMHLSVCISSLGRKLWEFVPVQFQGGVQEIRKQQDCSRHIWHICETADNISGAWEKWISTHLSVISRKINSVDLKLLVHVKT